MKVLILDEETLGIISMVFSQSDILQHEVFLTERLDSEGFFSGAEKMRHMNAVCLLRPTANNFLKLKQELKSPKYHEYHLFFTNVIPHPRLEQLACCDEHEVIQQVQEFYADVYAISHDLFSLNQPSTARLTEDRSRWTSYEESIFDRTLEGLLAVCMTLRTLPAIRYTASSQITRLVAERLQMRITEEQTLFEQVDREKRGESPPILLLLDRRDDPVTPLLNQWTYQALLHELLGLDKNRIDMSKVPNITPELKEIVMSSSQDQFYEENVAANFGDLGVSIKKYVEDYQKKTKTTAKIESIEEMQKFVDLYPEFRKLSGNVSKHVAVVHELSRLVDANGLLEISQLEQELACSENKQEHFRAIQDMIRSDNITNMGRLRLVLLYALRYETADTSGIQQLKRMLLDAQIGEDQVALLDQLLRYAGQHARSGDLFQNKSVLAMAKSTFTRHVQGVENVYTQHKSHLAGVAESLMKGRLKDNVYPFHDSRHRGTQEQRVPRAIIFIMGGATYEEARDIAQLNRELGGGQSIVLGGTTVHNSRSFLADIAQLNMPTGPE